MSTSQLFSIGASAQAFQRYPDTLRKAAGAVEAMPVLILDDVPYYSLEDWYRVRTLLDDAAGGRAGDQDGRPTP